MESAGSQSRSPWTDSDDPTFNPQALSSQPPIFQDYTTDPSSFNNTITSGMFAPEDDSWAYGGYDNGDDQGDAKRRRIARACDSCRRKKIKCDAKMPKCSHCENYNTECVFTHIEKKRAPPKGTKYIEGLENRLGRMEHLLRLSGLLGEDEEGGADLGILEQRLAKQGQSSQGSPRSNMFASDRSRPSSQSGPRRRSTPQRSQLQSPASGTSSPRLQHGDQKAMSHSKETNPEVDDLADMMWCSLVTNNQGETRFIGSSSGFSIFSPKGIQWVNEKTGDNSFNDMIGKISQDDNKWYPWREEVFHDIFARRVFKELPERAECESLMVEFFENFNRMFPLFHEPTFMHLVDMQYSDNPYNGSGWWACLNLALAIAHRIRILKNQLPRHCDGDSWAYFKNALAVLSELTMRNTDLLSVQALIGMCLFLQGSPNPQPSFFLIGAAIRLAHSIGLHKHGSGFGLNLVEVEQRKRVFWIAYMIDKDICLRSGRPPSQDDDDWNVDLPSEEPEDGVGTVPLADGGKTNLFRTLCRYAVISAKVYNKLYSVKAARQSDGELLNTIGELDAELEAWKDSIPVDFRPEHSLAALPPQLVIHIVILHFSYYNILTTIHRRSVHHGYWSSRLSDYAARGLNVKPLNPRVFSSAALCVSAARTSIHLIKYIPPSDYAYIWLILYYPISAMVTLFANILQNPQDVRARADLKLIQVVVGFLKKIVDEDTTGSMQRMMRICTEFERIAKIVITQAEKDMSSGQKRKQERERDKMNKRGPEVIEIPQPTRNSQDVQMPSEGFPYYPKSGGQDQQQRSSSDSSHQKTGKGTPTSGGSQQPSMQPSTFTKSESADQANDVSASWQTSFPNDPSGPQASGMPNQGFPNSQHSAFSSDLMASAFDANPTETSSPDYTSFPPGASFGDTAAGQGYTFQQPMVPQDLWNMPMTFQWDWSMPDTMGAFDMNSGLNMGSMSGFDMPFGQPTGSGANGMQQQVPNDSCFDINGSGPQANS